MIISHICRNRIWVYVKLITQFYRVRWINLVNFTHLISCRFTDLYFDEDDHEYCFHNALTDKFTFLKKLPVIQTLHSIESLFFPMTPPLTPQYNLVPQHHDIHSNYLGSFSDLNVLDTSFISSSTPLPPWPQLNAPTGLVTPASFCDAVKKISPEVNPPSPLRVSQIAQTINLQTTASNTITASITASTSPVPSVDCNDCKTTIR